MEEFNQYQFDDLLVRGSDFYTQSKDRIILDRLKNRASPLKILEVGCGSGELSLELAEKGHKVVGIDLAPEYIKLAQGRKVANKNGSASFQASAVEEFSPKELFDVVVAMDVLEHIKDDAAAAKKLAELLRPAGELILTVPAMPSLFGFHDEKLEHFRRYSKTSLARLMEKTELIKTEKIRYFGFTLIPVCVFYSKILRRAYPKISLGSGKEKTLLGFLADKFLEFDRRFPAPLGISLVLFGKKRL